MNTIKKVLLCPWDNNRTQFDFMDQGDLKKKRQEKIENAQPRAFVHILSLYLCGFINVKFHSAYKSALGKLMSVATFSSSPETFVQLFGDWDLSHWYPLSVCFPIMPVRKEKSFSKLQIPSICIKKRKRPEYFFNLKHSVSKPFL